jgi:hypothetical protein
MPTYRFELGSTHHGVLFAENVGVGVPATLDVTVAGPKFTIAFEGDRTRATAPTSWFVPDGGVPEHLVFRTHGLQLTCFGVPSWSCSVGSISIATFEPSGVVADLWYGEHDANLTATTVQSELDHLSDWTRFSASSLDTETDERDRVRRLSIELAARDRLVWSQGDASMTLTTNWEHTPGMTGVHYDEAVVLESRFRADRPIRDHMLEQQKVRDLLIVMYNAPAYFRRHRVRSHFIREQSGASREPYNHLVAMIGGFAAHEQGSPQPVLSAGHFAVVYPGQFGAPGFENWAKNYERLERVIRPLVRILQRPQALAEDRVVAIGIALEAAGSRLPRAEGESETYRQPQKKETTAATFVYRVLAAAGITSKRFAASPSWLARGIADTYNATKHPNRDLPSGLQSHGVAALGTLALQIYLAKGALGYAEPVSEQYGDHFVDQIALLWENLGLFVGQDGEFIPREMPSLWPLEAAPEL